jgi:hypothetical protein
MAQTIQGGGQMVFGNASEPYLLPYHTPLAAGGHWYLANHPPGFTGFDGTQGDPMWFMVQTSAHEIVEFTANGGDVTPTWITFLAHSSIGKFYSDGQNWRITNDERETPDSVGSVVYPLDII